MNVSHVQEGFIFGDALGVQKYMTAEESNIIEQMELYQAYKNIMA